MTGKMVLWTALFGCIALMMQGCAYGNGFRLTQDEPGEYRPEARIETQPLPAEQDTQETTEETAAQTQEESEAEVPEIYYAYHALDTERQKLYLEILDALENMEKDAKISTLDKAAIDPVFACVMNDHPELFYVEGYQYTEYTFGKVLTGITFSGTYSMAEGEAQQAGISIGQSLQECFSQVPLNEDEYSTAKFLYEWLIQNTEYDQAAEDNQNICSVFLQGRSVCQGYAKAMQYMLQKAGIQCLLVTGFTNGERHAWNLVKVNGEYYYLDPTWGDASYFYNGLDGEGGGQAAPAINYDYFLVTTEEITRTHSFEKVVELPECTSVADNYYVREGFYFDEYDAAGLSNVFNSETAKEDDYVTIKCSDAQSFAVVVQELIESQKVFDFIGKQNMSISYTANEEQHTISFWNLRNIY